MRTKYLLSSGREVALPARHLLERGFTAVFLVSAKKVARLLPTPRLDVAGMLPGWTLLVLAYHDFADSPVGPYRQLAISFPVYLGGFLLPALPLLSQLLLGAEKLFRRLGLYVWQIPTSSAESCAYSREIWGEPAWLGEFETKYDHGRVKCRLYCDGELVCGLELSQRGIPLRERKNYRLFSLLEDRMLVDLMWVDGPAITRPGPGNVRVTFGRHPLAQELRCLLSPALAVLTTCYHRATVIFGGPTEL